LTSTIAYDMATQTRTVADSFYFKQLFAAMVIGVLLKKISRYLCKTFFILD